MWGNVGQCDLIQLFTKHFHVSRNNKKNPQPTVANGFSSIKSGGFKNERSL